MELDREKRLAEALQVITRVELLGFASGQPILHQRYIAAAKTIAMELGTGRCVDEITKAVDAFTGSHPESWQVERVPPIVPKELWLAVNGLLMAEEGVPAWLSGYLEQFFGRPPEDLEPFAEAFFELRAEFPGQQLDDVADRVNRLSRRQVKELGAALGIKVVRTSVRFAAYGSGMGLPLVDLEPQEKTPQVLYEATKIARLKEVTRDKIDLFRTAITCLLVSSDKVDAMLEEVAGLGGEKAGDKGDDSGL